MKKILAVAFTIVFAFVAQAKNYTTTKTTYWEGETSSGNSYAVEGKPAYVISANTSITFTDCSLTSSAATGTIYMKDGSSIVLNNCTVANTNTKNKGASAIYVEPGAKVSITINGATITSEQWGIDLQGASTITMTNGTIDGKEYGIILQAGDCSLAITGGQISNIVRMQGVTTIATKPTGGVYKNAPAPFYIPSGYSIAGNTGDYAYLLAKATSVIPVETYTTIDIVKPSGAGNAIKITINGNETTSTTVDLSMLNVNPVQKITVQEVDAEGNNVGEAVEGAAIKVDSTAEDTTVAVPYEGATVQDVFDTATLAAGDTISVYDSASGKYVMFELNEAKTAWEGMTDATTGETPAADLKLERGAAIILHRDAPEKPIVLLGATSEEAVEQSAKAPASGAKSTHTEAIGNPSIEEMSIKETMTGTPKDSSTTVIGDEVVVQQEDGSYKTYRHQADGWKVVKREVVNGRLKTTLTAEDPVVKPGRSFFYRSNGGAPKFTK